MNMYQFLESAVAEAPDSLFLTREKITYKQFMDNVARRAATLADMGVKKDAVVGILSHNLPEFPLTAFALWYLGARALMLDTNLTPFEYDNMAKATDCKLICAEKSFFYKTKLFEFHDIQAKDGSANPKLKPAKVADQDTATLSYTSGSTGTPKIVPLTHFNLTECAHSLQDMKEWIHRGDTLYGFLPMYHVYGFAIEILATIEFSGNILLQPGMNPKDIMDDFAKYRPQIIPAVPRLWEVFRNKIIDGIKAKNKWWLASFVLKYGPTLKEIGLGDLVKRVQDPVLAVFGGRARLLIAGGAATKPEVETFYERLGLTFIQGYGLTETVGPICISKPGKDRLPFAIGGTITNNEFEIRDKDMCGVGILWLRGNQVFGGYLNNPTANDEAFDSKGFFSTGDLMSVDKNGELHFHGRKKQVIVLDGGKNVYPDELEAMYLEIKGVKNVAVFEHKVRGKTVSYGVFSVEPDMTMAKLAHAIAEKNKRIASYKWVTHFAMTTDDLPLTSTQKVKHHVVRQNLETGKYPSKKE